MSAKPKILVTAAAGHTGSAAVYQLLEKGFPVRAFVRRRAERATALEQAGAELFIGDLFDYRDLKKSLIGVQRAYYCPPFVQNFLQATMMFAVAAEEAKLEVVALMSQWNPHATHPSIMTRDHWLSNQVYRWMPSVDVIHINPGLFAFMHLLGLQAVAHFGMMMAPFGSSLNAPPSNEDIARVAVAALADPVRHIGKNYRPTGPKLVSPQDTAKILGKVLGRKVTYKDVSFKTFSKAAIAMGVSPLELASLRHYFKDLRDGAFAVGAPTDHVREVAGVEPEDFESTVRRYVQNPSLIHPIVKIGSKFEAFKFLGKMLATRPADVDAWERDRGYPLLTDPVSAYDSAEWRATAERKQLNLILDKNPAMRVVENNA